MAEGRLQIRCDEDLARRFREKAAATPGGQTALLERALADPPRRRTVRRLLPLDDRWQAARVYVQAIRRARLDEAECVLVALRETDLSPAEVADQLRRYGGLVATARKLVAGTDTTRTELDKAQAEVRALEARKDALEAEITAAVEAAAKQASHGFATLRGRMESAVGKTEAAARNAEASAAFTQAGADQIISAVTENAERNREVLREGTRETVAGVAGVLAKRDATLLRAAELGLIVEGVDGNPDIDRPTAALRILEKYSRDGYTDRNRLESLRQTLASFAAADSEARVKAAGTAAPEAHRNGTAPLAARLE